MMKFAVLTAVSLAVVALPVSAQNCIGQGSLPVQAPPACLNRVAECLCNSEGIDCHLVWTCQPWPAAKPAKTAKPATTTPPNQSPLEGLAKGIAKGRQLRKERKQRQQTKETKQAKKLRLQEMRDEEERREADALRTQERVAKEMEREEAAAREKAAK